MAVNRYDYHITVLLEDRPFLLGIDNSESEDLKRHTGHKNYEQIGSLLVRDCPDQTESDLWQTAHLSCNMPELQRMRVAGVTDWLFHHGPTTNMNNTFPSLR